MSELKTISIDGVEHDYASLNDQQKAIIAQIGDITQKLGNLQFQVDQLSVAKDAFTQMLKASLQPKAE